MSAVRRGRPWLQAGPAAFRHRCGWTLTLGAGASGGVFWRISDDAGRIRAERPARLPIPFGWARRVIYNAHPTGGAEAVA